MTGPAVAAAVVLTAAMVLTAAASSSASSSAAAAAAAFVVYTLNGQNVEWPGSCTRDAYAGAGRYVAKNVMATRVQVWHDRAFVLTPRFRPGVPFTVSAVRLDCRRRCWPVLSPYPRWSAHDDTDPTAVQNAVDMYLDPTGVLWVLDTGPVDAAEQPVRRARPRVFAIDVNVDKVSRTREQNVWTNSGSPAWTLGFRRIASLDGVPVFIRFSISFCGSFVGRG